MKGLLSWQLATVTGIREETSDVKSFTFSLPDWTPHLPGQHYDIRLTAEDGYQAQRSYSIASEPDRRGEIDLTVERIEGGEASPFLHDVVTVGDRIELRGPIGGYFVWDPSVAAAAAGSGSTAGSGSAASGSLLLIAGGSGVVPLMAMVRHRASVGSHVPTALVYSSRTRDGVIYYDELERLRAGGDGLNVLHTLTREQPTGWTGYTRRIDRPMLSDALDVVGAGAEVFICGPTLLVEAAAENLVGLGLDPAQIRTERFGPTGT